MLPISLAISGGAHPPRLFCQRGMGDFPILRGPRAGHPRRAAQAQEALGRGLQVSFLHLNWEDFNYE